MTSPTVADVGEQGVLAQILPLLPTGEGVTLGPGDDAAVIDWPHGTLVTTCDLMIEGPDFRRNWSTGFDVGWKAMASNLADVAAMGATPRGVVIGLAVPDQVGVSAVADIARGVAEGLAQMAPGCGVWGGDLSESDQVMISVTVIGDLEGRAAITRQGASVGDVVAVGGVLGQSSRGLSILLEAGEDAEAISGLLGFPEVIAHLRPTPPLHLGIDAARGGATAMMDISDGLLLDAARMARASRVAIDLHSAAVVDDHALSGGEDHSLLACFPPGVELPPGFLVIGQVVEPGEAAGLVTVDGVVPAGSGGWDPYRRGNK
jgi:thiamine-monophosphate kinase